MELQNLFTPWRAVSPEKSKIIPTKTSYLNEFLEEPIISADNKDRAKKISESLQNPEPEVSYTYDDFWTKLESAESTSDYTNAPESWKLYNNLLPSDIKNKAKKARNFFMKRLSLSREQASGIVGVLISETKLDPTSFNKSEKKSKNYYGAGIGSWTSPTIKSRIKTLLEDISGTNKGEIEDYTLDEQLEAYARDLENHPNIYNLLKKSETVDDAADIVTRGIENGGMSGKLVSKKWFDKGYHWIKGKDSEGNDYTNHYEAAMYNVDPKYAIGRAISSRIVYNLS